MKLKLLWFTLPVLQHRRFCKLITNLRKDGKALQSTSAVRYYDVTEASSPEPVQRAAATPPKITPVTKPVATSSKSQNNQTFPSVQDNSRDDEMNELLYEDSQRRERDTAATATIAAIDNANTSSAPARTEDKAKKQNSFTIDLSDVHPQPPIPKSAGHIKDGASKYAGVTFYKARQKWIAQIMIDGNKRRIGMYDNEEEAAVDYARAKFKYRNVTKLRREGKDLQSTSADVPVECDDSEAPSPEPVQRAAQTPQITPVTNPTSSSTSQGQPFQAQHDSRDDDDIDELIYGESQSQDRQKATAEIAVVNEKENAWSAPTRIEDQETQQKARNQNSFVIDLSDVLPQPPVPKSAGHMKEGTSKYTGVSFQKSSKKWIAQITIDGKVRYIGSYDNEEEAAVDYARAVFKYKNGEKLEQAYQQQQQPGLSHAVNQSIQVRQQQQQVQQQPQKGMPSQYNQQQQQVQRNQAAQQSQAQPQQPQQQRRKFNLTLEAKQALKEAVLSAIRSPTGEIDPGALQHAMAQKLPKQAILNAAQVARKRDRENREQRKKQMLLQQHAMAPGFGELERAKERNLFKIDLSDVPPQPPIIKSSVHIIEGASKYKGVYFQKATKKWVARIDINGKGRHIGTYDDEEKAAVDYARAVFKYRGGEELERDGQPPKRKLQPVNEEGEIVNECDTSKRHKESGKT